MNCGLPYERSNEKMDNLVQAIEGGRPPESVVEALRNHEKRRNEFREEVGMRERPQVGRTNRVEIETAVCQRLDEWRGLLVTRRATHGRQLLRELLAGPLRFTPDGRVYRFEGEASFGAVFSGGTEIPTNMVPVRGFEPRFQG